MLEQFRKNCNLWEEHTWKKFMECSHGRDFTLEQGKSVRSTFPEEEGFAETTGDEMTTAHPPVLLHWEVVENYGLHLRL